MGLQLSALTEGFGTFGKITNVRTFTGVRSHVSLERFVPWKNPIASLAANGTLDERSLVDEGLDHVRPRPAAPRVLAVGRRVGGRPVGQQHRPRAAVEGRFGRRRRGRHRIPVGRPGTCQSRGRPRRDGGRRGEDPVDDDVRTAYRRDEHRERAIRTTSIDGLNGCEARKQRRRNNGSTGAK